MSNNRHQNKFFINLIRGCFVVLLCLPQVSWSRTSVSELETRVEGLENKLDSNLNFELSSKLEFLQKEIQELRGIVEEQQHLIANLTTKPNYKNQQEIDFSKIKLQPEQMNYKAAYKLIEEKKFAEAIIAFKDFLLQYKDSKYAPNAIYWLGELYFTDHNFDIAADYFLQVIDKYKDHDKAPDALLKLGMLELDRENWQAAKNYFLKIKKDYSNCSRVHMADSKLQSLERDGH